jgi:tetratricopeptide (TPR) repeat protein/CHAT domain-containing protein
MSINSVTFRAEPESRTAADWIQLGADLHDRLRRFTEAEQAFRNALKIDPDSVYARGFLGNALFSQGRIEEAENWYRLALVLDPIFANSHNGLGNVFLALGRHAEAEACYREAARVDPNCAEWHSNLGMFLTDRGKPADGEKACREAIRLAPRSARAHHNLGEALRGLRRSTESIIYYREAIQLEPINWLAHNGLGNALLDLAQPEEAAASFREAICLAPDSALAHANLGNALIKLSKPEEAITFFKAAIQLDPNYALSYVGLGNAYSELGRPEDAEDSFQKAIRIDPHVAFGHYNLGNALRALDRGSEAEASFREAIRLDENHAPAYVNLGNLLFDANRLAEAEPLLRKAIRIDSGLVPALHSMGNLLLSLGQFAEAVASFREAIRLDPKHAVIHNGLGNALSGLDLHTEAEAAFLEALRLDPTFAMAHASLGRLYMATNRSSLALASNARAVQLTLGQPSYLSPYIGALQAVERTGPLALISALAAGGAFGGVLDVALEMGRGDLGTALGKVAFHTFGGWVPPGRPYVESLLLEVMRGLDEDSERVDADAASCADAPSSAQPPAALQVLADARESLVWASLDSDERTHWLNLFDGLGARAARLCLRAGQPELAAEHLERSLAIDLTQSALVKLVDLQRFVESASDDAQRQQRPILKVRYDEALKAWEAARYTPEPGSSVESQWLRIRQARLGIYLALLAIRQEDSSFGEPTRWPAIAKLSHARALGYLGADAEGGLGVLVHQGAAYPIPGLEAASDERLKELIAPLETLYEQRVGPARLADAPPMRATGWLGGLFRGGKQTPAAGTPPDDGPWNAALDAALRGLWELVMAPVTAEARRLGVESITLFPSGPLAMLPLQLAWRETVGDTTTAGRRYALQDLCIAFAPSAGLLAPTNARSTTVDRPEADHASNTTIQVLAILDDTILDEKASIGSTSGRAAPSYADQITAELHRIWGEDNVHVLSGAQATPQAVFAALDAQPDVVYFFGHGTAAGSLGNSSCLRLASGQAISLEEVLRHTHRQSLWVVLACEAARGKRDIPRDEAVSFAGGLLQAGVEAVVAATVPIAQHLVVPLSLKMLAHHARGMSPAQALRWAQREVVEGTGALANADAQSPVQQRRTPPPARVPTLGMGVSAAAAQADVESSPHMQRPGHWALQCFGG